MYDGRQIGIENEHIEIRIGYNINRLTLKAELVQGMMHDFTKEEEVSKRFISAELGFLIFYINIRFYI